MTVDLKTAIKQDVTVFSPLLGLMSHSPFRAFLVSFFVVMGAFFGLLISVLLLVLLSNVTSEETFSSSVKIQPDAQGNRTELSKETPILLQINIKGEIGKDELTGTKIENILLKSREDNFKPSRVKGVLLVIDSPGGSANDSDIIFRHLRQYQERYKVPIFAYVDGICASGGYYIACAADKILASDVSLIGSIGVLSWPPFFNVSDLLKKVGVNSLTLSAGKDKDELNPTRPWREGESKNRQELIDFFYTHFVEIVSDRRPSLDKEKLIQEFGAQVFSAPMAQKNGYVDKVGCRMSDAVKALALASGISEDKKYQVVTIETKEWYKRLFGDESFLWTGKIKHEWSLSDEMSLHMKNPISYQW